MILALKTLLSVDELKNHSFYDGGLMSFHGYNPYIHWVYFEIPDCAYTEYLLKEISSDKDIIEYSVDVEGLKPNFSNEVIPTTANFANQWAFKNTGQYNGFPGEDARITKAWTKELGSYDIIVAVIDSGIDVDHECLLGHIYVDAPESVTIGQDTDGNGYKNDFIGWNFAANTSRTYTASHGTALASIITTNGNGISGVTWKSRIMPVAIGDISGWDVPRVNFWAPCSQGLEGQDTYSSQYAGIPTSRVAAAITYAANKGAHIICVAYSMQSTARIQCCGTYPVPTYMADVRDAIKYAGQCGCIVVSSAGDTLPDAHIPTAREGTEVYKEFCANNENETSVTADKNVFPGGYARYFPHMINVTAMTNWGYLYYDRVITSNSGTGYNGYMYGCAYGPHAVNIAAPGQSILVAQPGNTYGLASGSSVAAAFVAGTAALIWSRNPFLRHSEVVALINQSARRNAYWTSRVSSGGVLDVDSALLSAMSGY